MSLFFRKIQKRNVTVRVENFSNSEKSLDDILAEDLTTIGCNILQQTKSNELVIILKKQETSVEDILKIFNNLKISASVVNQGTVYNYEYGLPKFCFTVTRNS